ncbi:MAG: hypothetical protein KJ970_06580 [Candidatus Eisenbacteria bacterium]|uniref:M20/M25/M40 family metallo-hydrolase n=1 Tax=Eiseniibacteriota bacterium TaxID=2212470 RepID=A0A948WC45_UNCEI|nr:hypothetical protein [Candidatus Eisenbacteria bacterium]MBU1948848.1 hypothetical protein [Candidatus Eisenbacteria bacterium]MBU2690578.1 hypothetical protein [Candidatus Eisenbacteria bacterium]
MICTTSNIIERARRICSPPTTSFYEEGVAQVLLAWAAEIGLPRRIDEWGNLHVGPAPGRTKGRTLILTAHMDHPGFVVESVRGRRARCRWFGGVLPDYFDGAIVRIERWSAGRKVKSIRGRITSKSLNERGRVASIRVLFDEAVHAGEIGCWDLPSFRRVGNHLFARAADDLMGCVAITLAMDAIAKLKRRAPVRAIFTRAEEVGFAGATTLALSDLLPREALIIVMETSKELPRALQGRGPVLRVGDRMTLYDPGVAHFLHKTAESLSASDRRFKFQRCLMDGGACEATAFGLLGARTGAFALPLRHYHNMSRTRLAPEMVHLEDLRGLVTLLTAIAGEAAGLPVRGSLPAGEVRQILKIASEYRKDLKRPYKDIGQKLERPID